MYMYNCNGDGHAVHGHAVHGHAVHGHAVHGHAVHDNDNDNEIILFRHKNRNNT